SSTLLEVEEHTVDTPTAAAYALQQLKYRLRQDGSCDPAVFLEASHDAGPVLELLLKHDQHSRDRVIDGRGPALAYSTSGVPFANRRSELFHKFNLAVRGNALLLPI